MNFTARIDRSGRAARHASAQPTPDTGPRAASRRPRGRRASPVLLACLALLAGASGAAGAAVKLNQLGFLPASQKLAVVTDAGAGQDSFALVDAASGKTVFEGRLGAPGTWDASGETVRVADFSALRTPGSYKLRVNGQPESKPFPVAADAYRALDAAAIKAYYYQRASIAIEPRYAGTWARPLGHPDNHVLVHESAASKERPAGTVISSPKGWYDAGDYNKYIVNSGISTYTLLAAYEHFPQFFDALALNIPESGNGLPDLLNEALWNLEWMATMQDPNDGGVYHKLTNKQFDAFIMPDKATGPRYVVQKSTAATLDFAAVMAVASRVLAPFDKQDPGRSKRYLAQAEKAWAWAVAHPDAVYKQPADIGTGDYGDNKLDDEFSWAATELLIATGKDAYRARALAAGTTRGLAPGWADVRQLGWISLVQQREHLPKGVDAADARRQILAAADTLLARAQASPYRISMATSEFNWGSNSGILNEAMMLVQAYRLTGRADYLQAAQSALDYVMGRNGPGRSFVTGFGAPSPMHPHHRPSEADGIAAPVPGWMVGGPNPGQQDLAGCKLPYPSKLPALSYLDDVCSYASGEVAINWNAPLVYVTAAVQALVR
ncbi:glycoside hydrolase family 9 protein [Massilia sp. 9096]|uniref:glycoside hydrolase family 9 protein n=1 Tax=Massilia sp. 9096 TaxID=1500894 RepID=UPI0009DCCB26|nr:glycoside hydrolase family 9 protein [Massilia sp. 9096]